MPFTKLSQRSTIALCVGIVSTGLPLIALPSAADPYAPIRALVAGIVLVCVGLLWRGRPSLAGLRAPAVLLSAAGVGYLAAAAVNGPASAVFGVHGRYQGLVSAGVWLGAAVIGATVMRRHVFLLAWPLAVAGTIQGAIVVGQRALEAVPTGTMGNQVLAGGWLAVASATVLAAALVSSGRSRWWLLGASVATALGAGATGSRGAWFGLAVGAAVAVVLTGRRRAMLVGGVGVALVLGALLIGGPESVAKLDPAALASGSAASRWQIWRGTVHMIADHPVLGVGPGRFIYEFPAYEPFERAVVEYGDVRADQAHSELLQLAAEGGLLVAALVVALLAMALSRGVRAALSRDGAALIAVVGLAASLGQGVFGITTVETGVLTWLLAGIALARVSAGSESGLVQQGSMGLAWIRVGLVTLGVTVACASGMYLAADTSYARGLEAFGGADFATAIARHRSAQRLLPIVDTYRVGEADAAAYLSRDDVVRSLASLDRGLELEPDSYDLAFARARALKLLGRDVQQVAQAYQRGVELYPLGIEIRLEAVDALYAAGRSVEARAIERDVARLQQAAENRQVQKQ